ncbi:uncharacterized protein LOC123509005 isoform X2 [Portunus trituberculatus]|uniref:uncharacterized protein LOC123509005 isoform X2 n=1 Tax=Portunus trituberculatus TaxID=210409 RepID=UPI001E1CF953|nr:uncharacterized protein LOC123509005 isoform X2 [Portunus trituberculatus]
MPSWLRWQGCWKWFKCDLCPVSSAAMEERTPQQLLQEHLEELAKVEQPPSVTLDEVVALSDQFPVRFPTQTARLKTLLKGGVHDEATLEEHVNSAYPVVHERVLPLLAAFLHFKRHHGRKKEREVYGTLGLLDLVDRLLKKRPIVFYNPSDVYVLRDGFEGCDGFQDIGHSKEHGRLILRDYLSYDEMKLSALVAVSSHSVFINDGGRHNRGLPAASDNFVPRGVIVGQVGARFEREGVMEWQDCVVTPHQNTPYRGYGKEPPSQPRLARLWAHLWGEPFLPSWEEAAKCSEDEFVPHSSELLFNVRVYKARIQLPAETLLAEAGARAASVGLKAYVRVVGLGLGVWSFTPRQKQLFVDAWADALAAADTSYISHVDFTWISDVTRCGEAGDGEEFPGKGVVIRFTKSGLHSAPLPDGTLLVTSFAWDSNSLPGNEYWRGMLSASGDPAAACSSTVAELHNSLINPRVTATNLHVASPGRVSTWLPTRAADYRPMPLRSEWLSCRCGCSSSQNTSTPGRWGGE